ncbi:MAG: O-antigen ligase family protein, partial [Thermoleophilaceae bacterium]
AGSRRSAVPRSAYFAASALLGLAFVALVFAGGGGLQLDDITRVELPLIVLSGLVIALAVLYGRRGPLSGALPLVLFAALAALTALSVAWSIAPADSWAEANRTLAYLMAFGAALVAARMFPRSSAVLLNALIVALGAVAVYALITRVWPEVLSAEDQFARISEPLGYWNAVGATAAMSIPPILWLGTRRSGSPLWRALAFPLLGLVMLTMLLTQSRGSLAAGLFGVGLWLALVPLRLRTLPVLLIPAVVAGAIAAWALSKGAFTLDRVPGIVRESVANEFGLMLVVGFALLLLIGLAVGFRQGTRTPSVRARRRLGIALALGVLALPLIGVSALAASDRGLTGTVSYRVAQLTGEETATAGGPERLTQVSSTRSRYWRQAGRVFESSPTLGTGADTWGIARLRYRVDQVPAQHAHGYVAQVMSDLGIAGLVLSGALLLSWLYVALRNTSLNPRARGREWPADRVGLVALALVAVIFGTHSALDWTWFVPGPTVMAMFAAGWVAGLRPPRAQEDEEAAAPAAAGPQAAAPPAAGPPSTAHTAVLPEIGGVVGTAGELPEAPSTGDRIKLLLRRDGWRIGLALGVVLATALFAWSAWQPQRADALAEESLALVEARRMPEAAATAERALQVDPLATKPLFSRATVADASGNPEQAERLLQQAVREHPADPRPWLRLGDFQLHVQNRPEVALETLSGAIYLDPQSRAARSYWLEARGRSTPGGDGNGGDGNGGDGNDEGDGKST